MTPFDFLTSVSFSKIDLLKDDPDAVKSYIPYIVNKSLSYFPDTLLGANEMNLSAHLEPKMQYAFFLHSIRKARRFSKWVKPEVNEDLVAVQQHYSFNTQKAKQALALLTPEQVKHIRTKAPGERNDRVRKHD